MLGGINNAALFDTTEKKPRFARNKLGQMGGIMSSSPQLIQAVQARSAPPAMIPKPPPLVPAGNMPVQPTLPTAVPPMPPKPQPQPPQPQQQVASAAPQPTAKTPLRMNNGGRPIDVAEAPKVTERQTLLSSLMLIPTIAPLVPRLVKMHGSEEKAEEELTKKKSAIDTAVASGNEENIANTVVDQAGLPVSDEGKKTFARNAFGMENVNDMDEINRRIANVAISGSIGKGNDAYVKAVLFGLNVMRDTASARAEAAADAAGGGFLDTEQGKAALQVFTKRIENNESPSEIEAMMNEELGNNIGTKIRLAISGASVATPQQQANAGGLEVGRTATNPETGEKIRWDGTKWQTV